MKISTSKTAIFFALLLMNSTSRGQSNILPGERIQNKDIISTLTGGTEPKPITEASPELKAILNSKRPPQFEEPDFNKSSVNNQDEYKDAPNKMINDRADKPQLAQTQSAPTKWNADGVDLDRFKKSKHFKRYGFNPNVDNERLYAELEANDLNVPALIAIIIGFLSCAGYILYKRKYFDNAFKRTEPMQPTKSTVLRHKKRELRDREKEILL